MLNLRSVSASCLGKTLHLFLIEVEVELIISGVMFSVSSSNYAKTEFL